MVTLVVKVQQLLEGLDVGNVNLLLRKTKVMSCFPYLTKNIVKIKCLNEKWTNYGRGLMKSLAKKLKILYPLCTFNVIHISE